MPGSIAFFWVTRVKIFILILFHHLKSCVEKKLSSSNKKGKLGRAHRYVCYGLFINVGLGMISFKCKEKIVFRRFMDSRFSNLEKDIIDCFQ